MNEQSRKVKNPLLTAAGRGFPFQDYASNALLMPVTPATPALLPDDSPKESSSGQDPAPGVLSQPPGSSSVIGFPDVQDLGTGPQPLDPVRRDQPSQPQRQGYFTSILSSLPNLSLSTITGDAPTSSSTTVQQQAPPTNPGRLGDSSVYGLGQNPYGPPPTSSGPYVASNPSREPTGHYHQGFGDIGVGVPPTSSPSPRPPPTAATLPPSGGPGSYRLGNQRRLKYAPPPDLTTSAPKQFPASSALDFLAPAQPQNPPSAASDFLIPSATFQTVTTGYPASGPVSAPNFYSGQIVNNPSSQTQSSNFSTISVSDSNQQQHQQHQQQQQHQRPPPKSPTNAQSFSQFRQPTSQYDRPISGWSSTTDSSTSAPCEIPSRFPETATPQNTPASASFAGYVPTYGTVPPTTLLSKDGPDVRVTSSFTSSPGPTKFTEGLTFDVPSSAFSKSNSDSISGTIIEPDIASSTEDTPSVSTTIEDKSFTHVSAAKVSAKLEHLLAERDDDCSTVKPIIEASTVLDGSFKPADDLHRQGQSIPANSDSNVQSQKIESIDELADVDLTANDPFVVPSSIQDHRPTSQLIAGFDRAPPSIVDSFARTGSHLSTPVETNASSKSSSIADSFAPYQNVDPTSSGLNFFVGTDHSRKSEINYFSTTNETTTTGFNVSQQSQITSESNPSSFFGSGPAISTPYASSSSSVLGSNANRQDNSTEIPFQPTFYDPSGFSSISREPTYSPFASQISANLTTVPNPFSTPLGSSPPNFPSGEAFVATAMPEPSGSATLNPVQTSVNPGHGRSNPDMVPPSLQSLAAGPMDRRMQYRPVYHHWFYRKEVESKVLWLPFSMQDSLNLEDVHNSSEITPETTVATDGGRYDVDILRRQRSPVYWTGNPTEVRRSSWFYKGSTESRYIPYEETISARLEDEYKQACTTDNWNRRIDLNNGEYIVFHSSSIQVHYVPATSPEIAASWGNGAGAASRPKVVKRGVDEFNIDEGEPEKVDHLLFIVHGIGSVCDLKFRTVEEVVDEFRSISLQLVQSHYRTASTHGVVNRVEVLPISWHTTLHSEDTGIDKKLQAITLDSIPKLRHFTNDTLLDILFYTSPIYCQTIMQTVGNEMNRLYSVFKERNPNFGGSVYLGGHSLGSLIVFDLLCHQKPPAVESKDETDTTLLNPETDDDTVASIKTSVPPVLKRRLSKKVSYMMGAAGTGQPFINYPQLSFLPQAFFALGSPIGMFVTVRGIDTLGDDFVLPTCPSFFNIFHPFDPVAYRVESLINPDSHKYRPMLIPHHKGRKRMHLELKETMARVGADLKQKLMDSVRSTWNSVYQLAMFHRPDNHSLEQEIEKVVEEQMQKSPNVDEQQQQNDDDGGADFRVGNLNGGRRIDYVLQEAPFEYINEYIFALTSHVGYWESEDTMLMILKEIYGTNGVQADAQLPPQTMTIERVSPSVSGVSTARPSGATTPVGTNPPATSTIGKPVGPPPTSGFVRKS